MSIGKSILPEFDHEMANTRKTLERVPDAKFEYKPHPKSPTMGWMAAHLANLPLWAKVTMERDELDIAPADGSKFSLPQPKNTKEALEFFDKHVAEARALIEAAQDEDFMKPWSLKAGGLVKMTMPKIGIVRGMVMNHIIHHRAQLGVYLRLNDLPVPALYGPSADEGAM